MSISRYWTFQLIYSIIAIPLTEYVFYISNFILQVPRDASMILYLLDCNLFMVLRASFLYLDGQCTNWYFFTMIFRTISSPCSNSQQPLQDYKFAVVFTSPFKSVLIICSLLNAHQSMKCYQIQNSSGRKNQLFRFGVRTLKRMELWS